MKPQQAQLFAHDPDAITLRQQITCAERELRYRERVYPKLVESGKFTQENADYQIAAMRAIIATLRKFLDDGK